VGATSLWSHPKNWGQKVQCGWLQTGNTLLLSHKGNLFRVCHA